MSDTFQSTVAAIKSELNGQARDRDKLGVLARSLRWHKSYDADDLAALLSLGELVARKKGPGCWEVERAVLEILCQQAGSEHVPFLSRRFRSKAGGKHSNDRRRLALQALSGVAARTANDEALAVLEEGLAHHKKDTRGWAIGFLLDGYRYHGRPLPQSVIDRLQALVENDISPDVRVEAVMALASLGMADEKRVQAVVAAAREQAGREEDPAERETGMVHLAKKSG